MSQSSVAVVIWSQSPLVAFRASVGGADAREARCESTAMQVSLFLSLFGALRDAASPAAFASYEGRFGKVYPDAAARAKAQRCYEANVAEAERLNKLHGPKTTFGETALSDECWEDFSARLLATGVESAIAA